MNRADVDGVVVYYDCYGQGVYQAIVENANFNGTNGAALPMGSVDIDGQVAQVAVGLIGHLSQVFHGGVGLQGRGSERGGCRAP